MTLPRAPAMRGATTPSKLPRKPPRIKRALWRVRALLLPRLLPRPLWSAVRRLRAVLWRFSLLCWLGVRDKAPDNTLWEHSANALTRPASPSPLLSMRRACAGLDLDSRHNMSACLRTAGGRPVFDFVLRPFPRPGLVLLFFLDDGDDLEAPLAISPRECLALEWDWRKGDVLFLITSRRMREESLWPETACFWGGSRPVCPG